MSVWTECQHEKRFGFVSQWLIVCSSILYVDVFGVVCSKNCLELCDAIWRCYLLLSGYSSEFVDGCGIIQMQLQFRKRRQ